MESSPFWVVDDLPIRDDYPPKEDETTSYNRGLSQLVSFWNSVERILGEIKQV